MLRSNGLHNSNSTVRPKTTFLITYRASRPIPRWEPLQNLRELASEPDMGCMVALCGALRGPMRLSTCRLNERVVRLHLQMALAGRLTSAPSPKLPLSGVPC